MLDRKQGCWVQCVNCGKIHHIQEAVPIDKLYVECTCPKCGHYKGLNCGENKESIYLYYDPTLDERYYNY